MNEIAATVGERATGPGVLADLPGPVSFTMPTPPSTNHLFRNVKGVGRVKASHYEEFIRLGVAAIRRQNIQPVAGRVVMVIGVERMSDRADIDNRLKAMLDAIVAAGTIADDNLITALAIAWLPKANGLSHVSIYPVGTLYLTFHPSHNGASGGWFSSAPYSTGDDDVNFP